MLKRRRLFGGLVLFSVLAVAFNIRQAECLCAPPTHWARTYGTVENHEEAHSLIQTEDGGYAMLGFTRYYYSPWVYTSDFWLVKTDSTGNVEWNRTYGAPTYMNLESGQSLVQTDDGGYALAGLTGVFSEPIYYDFWLVKTDSLGNMEWNQTYGGGDSDVAHSVVQTGDGGYAIAGYTRSSVTGYSDFYLVKTDSVGNMQWNQTYGGAATDLGWSVVLTGDGGYLIVGYTHSYGAGSSDIWLVKTDSAGSMQWSQTYGGTNADMGYSVVRTSDGGYALAGKTSSFGAGDYDFWLIKTDSDGTMQWNQTYGGTNIDEAWSMVQTSDGGYALLGRTNSFEVPTDYWLVKTNSTGDMEWNKTYGGPLADIGYAVVQTFDGGYAMAGYSNYYIDSYPVIDFWLVKTASGGDVNGDGIVDIFDLSMVGLAYGRFAGEPGYNPDADLNEDGVVDVWDISVVCINYGIGS